MNAPQIHGRYRSFAVSDALDAAGASLATIREQDELTWADMGRVLNKSDDQTRLYAKGLAEMPMSQFLLACREWNGRFANPVLELLEQKLVPMEAAEATDNEKLARILKLAHLLSMALLDDGRVDDEELLGIPAQCLDEAGRGIDGLRARRGQLERKSSGVVPLRG